MKKNDQTSTNITLGQTADDDPVQSVDQTDDTVSEAADQSTDDNNSYLKLSLAVDLLVLTVLLVNLGWLLFDWLYTFDWFNSLFANVWSVGHEWYGSQIHEHFYTIDLFFVAFFVSEILFSWVLAIKNKTFPKWYDYPFVHWYDVIGCIPVTGLRFLRLLRLVSILIRLQKLGWINFKTWWLAKALSRPYRIIVEEISDRVVINVLDGAKQEIRHSDQVEKKIIEQVIQPRADNIASELALRLTSTTTHTYNEHRDELAEHFRKAVHEAVEDNPEVANLAMIPLLGNTIKSQLDHAISDILVNTLDSAIGKLDEQLVNNIIRTALDDWVYSQKSADLTQLSDAISDILSIVQEQVAIKRWNLPKNTN